MIAASAALSLSALALGVASADRAAVNYPHVPLVLWSQRGTLNAQQTYVNAVVGEQETLNVLHSVLARDTDQDAYNVLSRDANTEPTAEALCVFVVENLKSSQLSDFGANSYVQKAVKDAKSSVVIAHTTRSESLLQGLKAVDHVSISIDDVAAWVKSTEGQKVLSNAKTELVVVEIPDEISPAVDVKIQAAAQALLASKKPINFALTGNTAAPIVVHQTARRSRRLGTLYNTTAGSVICDEGYKVGISSTGKAYCFTHYVHMTPEVLTALLFGFFFIFLAYVGISVLHAIQTPQRYPLHGPPKGKEF